MNNKNSSPSKSMKTREVKVNGQVPAQVAESLDTLIDQLKRDFQRRSIYRYHIISAGIEINYHLCIKSIIDCPLLPFLRRAMQELDETSESDDPVVIQVQISANLAYDLDTLLRKLRKHLKNKAIYQYHLIAALINYAVTDFQNLGHAGRLYKQVEIYINENE